MTASGRPNSRPCIRAPLSKSESHDRSKSSRYNCAERSRKGAFDREEGARFLLTFDRDRMRPGGCLHHPVSRLHAFNRDIVARRDFITYWATGQQLVHHGNPYDPDAVSRIERDAGFQGGASYYMRNAPWALAAGSALGLRWPAGSRRFPGRC